MEGNGRFTFHDGSVREGYWKDGEAYKSKVYYELTQVFASKPKLSKFKTLGVLEPFDFQKYITEGKLQYDETIAVGELKANDYEYHGQI